jgi:hypothetical protein
MIPSLVAERIRAGEEASRFWEIPSDDELFEFLMEDLMPALHLQVSDAQWASLPPGYAPLVTVLEFESHSQFEGWGAPANHRVAGMRTIVEAYRSLGLAQEADALHRVTEVLATYPDVMDAKFDYGRWVEEAGAAYSTVPNDTPQFEDRIPAILAFVRSNPRLFAAI